MIRRPGVSQHMVAYALFGAVVACASGVARADVTSDEPAAILVFPKVVVDTGTPPATARGPVDTLIRVTNTSTQAVSIHCFWINANGHCSNSPLTICDPNVVGLNSPCGTSGICQPGWQETDFFVNVTARQPVAWLASQGARACEDTPDRWVPCFPLGANDPPSSSNNGGSSVLAVAEDPFVGELKCIAVDKNDVPVDSNVLKGEAEIVRSTPTQVDVAGYNAIGIPAIPGRNNQDSVLVLGGGCVGGSRAQLSCTNDADCPGGRCPGEYSSCPNILILDHFFDGADDPISGKEVNTDITLVPCSEDFLNQVPVRTPVQFLVRNEFEQRFSTSRAVTCFQEFRISNIDTSSKDRSIFSAAVSGTLTGQTRIRGVMDQDPAHGHTLLGVAEEFRYGGGTAAFNLHFDATRPQSDFIYLP
jgi:hypothetical protein